MSRALAVALAAIAVIFGLLVEHLAHSWDQPAWIPILDLGVGWVLVASGLVGAIARPSQPAGGRLVLAGLLWFVGTPRQDTYPVVDDLAFMFQGWFDLVLVLIAASFPARWPARREERAVLVALAVTFGVRALVRMVVRGPDLGVDLLDPDRALAIVAWADVVLGSLFFVAGCLLVRRAAVSRPPQRRLIVPVAAAGAAAAFAEAYRTYYALTQLGFAPPLAEDLGVPGPGCSTSCASWSHSASSSGSCAFARTVRPWLRRSPTSVTRHPARLFVMRCRVPCGTHRCGS